MLPHFWFNICSYCKLSIFRLGVSLKLSEAYKAALDPASAATLSIMGLFVIIGIGYKMVEQRGGEAIYGGVVALSSFLVLTPQIRRHYR